MVNSKQKGKRGELLWAHWLKDHGCCSARRSQQFNGGEGLSDVLCEELSKFAHEVKFVENLNLQKAMDQSIRDAKGKFIPIVAHKRKCTEWLVTMRAEDWIKLARIFQRFEINVLATDIVDNKV